jgi:hypothetical protein
VCAEYGKGPMLERALHSDTGLHVAYRHVNEPEDGRNVTFVCAPA